MRVTLLPVTKKPSRLSAGKELFQRILLSLVVTGTCVLSSWGAVPAGVRLGSLIGNSLPEGLDPNLPPPLPNTFALPTTPIVPATEGNYLPSSSQVSPSGQFEFSLPVDLPPGRAGMKPNFAVTYSSGGGNGILGVGWNLAGFSMITRCPHTLATEHIVDGVDYSNFVSDAEASRDRFCLNGQKLVAIKGGYGKDGTEYRTEHESYSRIVSNSSPATAEKGPDSFVVYSKDGLVRVYTFAEAPRMAADVQNLTQIAMVHDEWLLASETDRNGNSINFQYVTYADPQGGIQHLPSKIEYTLSQQDPIAHRWVELAYEDRGDQEFGWVAGTKRTLIKRLKSATAYAPNPEITGPVWTYRFEYQPQLSAYSHRSLLASVQKCALKKNNINVTGGCLWKKEFTYAPGNTPTDIFDAPETVLQMPFAPGQPPNLHNNPLIRVLDVDGDGADELLVQGGNNEAMPDPVIITSRQSENGPFEMLAYATKLSQYNGSVLTGTSALENVLPIDIEGDGKTEIHFARYTGQSPNGEALCSSDILRWDYSAGFKSTPVSYPNLLCSDRYVFADLDGDTQLDRLYATKMQPPAPPEGYWQINMNIGGAFSPATIATQIAPEFGSHVVDFDGDSRAEIFGNNYDFINGLVVQGKPGLASLDDVGTFVGWVPFMGPNASALSLPYDTGDNTEYADLNGDRLQDALEIEHIPNGGAGFWQYYVRWNTGNGFGPRVPIANTPWSSDGVHRQLRVADINSDGRADLVVFAKSIAGPSSTIYILYSRGDGTFDTVDLGIPAGIEDNLSYRFNASVLGDPNGDGHIDIIRALEGDPNLDSDDHVEVSTQKPHHGDRLISVTDEHASWANERIEYSTHLSDKAPEPSAACEYPLSCVRRGLTVVRSVTSYAGSFGSNSPLPDGRTIEYSYEDFRADRRGRGALGYRKQRIWDAARPMETILEFEQLTQPFDESFPNPRMPRHITTVVPLDPLDEGAGGDKSRDGRPKPKRVNARITKLDLTHELALLNAGKSFNVRPTAWNSKEWEESVDIDWDMTDPSNLTSQHIYNLHEPANEKALRWRHGSSAYDDFGNSISGDVKTEGGASATFSATYDNLEGDWLIGLQRSQTVTAIESDNTSVTRSVDIDYDNQGRPYKIYREKNNPDPALRLTRTLTYADDGLMTSTKTEGGDGGVRETHYEYNPIWPNQPNERISISQVWQPFDVAEWRPTMWTAYHPAYGVLVATMDANGVGATATFNDLGFPMTSQLDGESPLSLSYAGHPDGFAGFDGTTTTMAMNGQTTQIERDSLGRTHRTSRTGFDGLPKRVDTQYDVLGRIIAASRPASTPTLFTQFTYDPLNRVRKTINPDLTEVLSDHTFFSLTTTDPMNQQSKIEWDRDGRTVRSTEWIANQPNTTHYAYAPFGLLHEVTDPLGNKVQHIESDVLGRTTQYADIDAGTYQIAYNGLGETMSKSHLPSGDVTTVQYDNLGRPINTTGPGGTTTFTYDAKPHAIGQLVGTKSPDGVITQYEFDGLGRPSTQLQIADGQTLRFGIDYDPEGHVAQLSYPSIDGSGTPGMTLKYGYNNHDYLDEITWAPSGSQVFSPLWQALSRNADGALTAAKLGNGLNDIRDYQPETGQVEKLKVSKGNIPLLDLTYTHDPRGLLETETDAVNGIKQFFGHDAAYRLTDWLREVNGKLLDTTYTYDPIGNLTDVQVNQQLVEHNSYGKPNGTLVHAMTGHSADGGITTTPIDYDSHGRQTKAGIRSVDQYTDFNLPQTITINNAPSSLAYNAFGQRTKKANPNNKTTYFDQYEHREGPAGKEHVFHISGPNGAIAQISQQPGKPPSVSYLLSDVIGSISAVVDETGVVQQRLFFDRWGARTNLDGSTFGGIVSSIHNGFSDLEHDDDLGLINMNGRVYDPLLKRMLTPDPHITYPLSGQNRNRYSYALNSPVNFTDRSGFDPYYGTPYEDGSSWDDGTSGPDGIPITPGSWADLGQAATNFGSSQLGWASNFGTPGGPLCSGCDFYDAGLLQGLHDENGHPLWDFHHGTLKDYAWIPPAGGTSNFEALISIGGWISTLMDWAWSGFGTTSSSITAPPVAEAPPALLEAKPPGPNPAVPSVSAPAPAPASSWTWKVHPYHRVAIGTPDPTFTWKLDMYLEAQIFEPGTVAGLAHGEVERMPNGVIHPTGDLADGVTVPEFAGEMKRGADLLQPILNNTYKAPSLQGQCIVCGGSENKALGAAVQDALGGAKTTLYGGAVGLEFNEYTGDLRFTGKEGAVVLPKK